MVSLNGQDRERDLEEEQEQESESASSHGASSGLCYGVELYGPNPGPGPGPGSSPRPRASPGEHLPPLPPPSSPLGPRGAKTLLIELAKSLEKYKDDLFVVALRHPSEKVDLNELACTLEEAKGRARLEALYAAEAAIAAGGIVKDDDAPTGGGVLVSSHRSDLGPAKWFHQASALLQGVRPLSSDPDGELKCPLVDSRHVFLEMCMYRCHQYDTLRRAKHSSMQLLYQLKNPAATHTRPRCSECSRIIAKGEVRWHCELCSNFDLCSACADLERPPLPGSPPPAAAPGRTSAFQMMHSNMYLCPFRHDLTPWPVSFGE